jgi:gliding motility-associated-like protein
MCFRKLYLLLLILPLSLAVNVFAQAPGCPGVAISGPGVSQGQVSIPCNGCITLNADALVTGLTSSYTVSSIPYAPPYPYNAGNPVFVNQDDIWSPIVTLPFDFCFFGNYYTQLVTGPNGVISFDLANAGGFCPWSFSASNPSPNLIRNAIFGPYHDIDPSVGGAIYQGVLGSYPCRTFVMNFYQVPMFSGSCNYMLATHQIVLYEATNVIEVYIQNAPLCATWNSGNKMIGIQNITGTVGYSPPGRNTGPWSATNEAWRFTPNGSQNYTIQWYNGPILAGIGPTVTVCPSTPTTYTAIATYDNCNYTQFVVTSQITVIPEIPTASVDPVTSTICNGQSVNLTVSATGTPPFTYAWLPNVGLSSPTGGNVAASPNATTTYIVTVTDSLACTSTASATVNVNPLPVITATASVNPVCQNHTSIISASGGQTYQWGALGAGQSHTVSPSATTTYQITGTDLNGCTGTAGVTLQVNAVPDISINNQSPDICEGENASLIASGGDTYEWNTGDTDSFLTVTPALTSTYQVTGTDVNGCTHSATSVVNVHSEPVVDFIANPSSGCIPLNVNFSQQVVSGDPISSYYWEFGTNGFYGSSDLGNPNKVFSQAGSYDVSLAVSTVFGCKDTLMKQFFVNANPNPVASFSADPQIAELGDAYISFIDASLGATNWFWDFGDGYSATEQNPVHLYEIAGQIPVILLVSNDYGCKDSTRRYVQIIHNIAFYVPNAFTPGENGVNDTFGPTGVGIQEIKFYVYDRWGKLVFYSNHLDKKWDGRINGFLPYTTSVYLWKAEVIYTNNIKEHFAGNVVLLR